LLALVVVPSASGRRRPRLEVLGEWIAFTVEEVLPDQLRADDLAVLLDHRIVGAVLESWDLSYRGDQERISDAHDDGEGEQHPQRGRQRT
jgi:hypothetical protein